MQYLVLVEASMDIIARKTFLVEAENGEDAVRKTFGHIASYYSYGGYFEDSKLYINVEGFICFEIKEIHYVVEPLKSVMDLLIERKMVHQIDEPKVKLYERHKEETEVDIDFLIENNLAFIVSN